MHILRRFDTFSTKINILFTFNDGLVSRYVHTTIVVAVDGQLKNNKSTFRRKIIFTVCGSPQF